MALAYRCTYDRSISPPRPANAGPSPLEGGGLTTRGRGRLRQLAEVRGWIGGFRSPHRDLTLHTEDGVRIAATYLPGPDRAAPAVVLCHGFAAHRAKPAYAALADALSRHVSVLAIDHRGHGGSSGRSTFGEEEGHDVVAAIRWLRAAGHATLVPVGASMGGTAVLGALAAGLEVDAGVTISTAAYRGRVRRPGLAELDEVVRDPVRRRLWQWVAGFRFVQPTEPGRSTDPVALAVDVPVPVLLVHGADDDYFPPSDADALAAAIPAPTTTWHEPAGFGHAETGFGRGFAHRLARAVTTFAADGRFPERDEIQPLG